MYAFGENEKLDEKLAFVRDCFLEEPEESDNYNEEELSRLRALAPKITEIIAEHEHIVDDYYARLSREEEEEEKQKLNQEFNELMNLSQKELAEKYMELKYGVKK